MLTDKTKTNGTFGPNCWAAALGDCSDKISREHILSRALFSQEVFVQGLAWCKSEPKKIGIGGLTRKILCTKHNGELSEADSTAVSASRVFREAFGLFKARGQCRPPAWTWRLRKFRVDARELERWFLKTLINIAYESDSFIGPHGAFPGQPPRDLVEVAYGQKPFRERAGFYLMAKKGEDIPSEDRVQVTTVSPIGESNRIIGARFKLQGFTYFLCLDENVAPERVGFVASDGSTVSQPSDMLYRHAHIKYLVHERLSHVIDIE